jgi:hypothetical protein
MAKNILKKAKNWTEDAITPSPSKWVDEDANLTLRGKLVFGGAIGAASAYAGFNQYNQDRLGRISGLVTATPDYSMYTKKGGTDLSAGADGSLVFALDRTKNGGYL